MRDKADIAASPARRSPQAADIAHFALIVGAVLLGWQIAIQPLIQRAPVETAIRLAPASPLALRRAAEAELAAGRNDNAAALGRQALVRSPFDVPSLRVVGLAEARAGRESQADDILTLAGNWSLRDSQTHAWLVERRLRQGDYSSAFAHADTLVRRRESLQPQVFRLFTVAATEDPQRSLPVTAGLLASSPPWRNTYLASLNRSPAQLQVQMSLAILLQHSRAPFSNAELQRLYRTLLGKGQFDAIQTLRARLNRPPVGDAVTNGDFTDASAPEPFKWRLDQKAGVTSAIVADDVHRSDQALRVDYDGYANARIAEQLVLLPPGSHRFSAMIKIETGDPAARLAWTLTCIPDGRTVASVPAGGPDAARNTWTPFAARIEVPGGCPAQWLRLETRAEDRRTPTAAWFDRIEISPAG